MQIFYSGFPQDSPSLLLWCPTKTMEEQNLPVIDFSPNADRKGNAKRLAVAMESVGFVYLDNVPGYNEEVEARLHKAAQWFF